MKITDIPEYNRIGTVRAIRVTSKNYDEISDTIDAGDGVLEANGDREDCFGEWVIVDETGNHLMGDATFKEGYKRAESQ